MDVFWSFCAFATGWVRRVLTISALLGVGAGALAQPATVSWAPTPSASTTDFYWMGSYGRGVGTPVDACPAGKTQRGALCYDGCRAGYSDHGTLTCSTDCPSGYTDMGALCQFDGQLSYTVGTHWDSCVSRLPRWMGHKCIGGVVEEGCRDGFHKLALTCWANLGVPAGMTGTAATPVKGTYNLAPVSMTCANGKVYDAGLCYDACRAGYHGVGPVCWANVPANAQTCGAGYARNKETCASVIMSQVLPVWSVMQDICSLSQFPFISEACTAAAEGVNVAKLKRFFGAPIQKIKDWAGAGKKSEEITAVVQDIAPDVQALASEIGDLRSALSGTRLDNLFTDVPRKIAAAVKRLDAGPKLKALSIVNKLRKVYEQPPFEPQGTDTEKAFATVRELSNLLGIEVAMITLIEPEIATTPAGQSLQLASDSLALIAGYLYTVQGE